MIVLRNWTLHHGARKRSSRSWSGGWRRRRSATKTAARILPNLWAVSRIKNANGAPVSPHKRWRFWMCTLRRTLTRQVRLNWACLSAKITLLPSHVISFYSMSKICDAFTDVFFIRRGSHYVGRRAQLWPWSGPRVVLQQGTSMYLSSIHSRCSQKHTQCSTVLSRHVESL